MHPEDRVRIVVETARAVLADRLEPEQAAATFELQRAQIGDLLRQDRDSVTRSEAESVALTLRRLAEQISDRGSAEPGTDAYLAMARLLGELAQSLR